MFTKCKQIVVADPRQLFRIISMLIS